MAKSKKRGAEEALTNAVAAKLHMSWELANEPETVEDAAIFAMHSSNQLLRRVLESMNTLRLELAVEKATSAKLQQQVEAHASDATPEPAND